MSTVGLSQIMPLVLEKDVDTLWSEFDLGSLIQSDSNDNNDLSLEKKIQNDTFKKLMHSKHPLHKHHKEWSRPQYAVLKARYNSAPIDPPVLDPKKIDRLADPIRGRYRNYDELKAEIEQEESDIQNIVNGNNSNNNNNDDSDLLMAQQFQQFMDGENNPETENNEGEMHIPKEFLIESPSKRRDQSKNAGQYLDQNMLKNVHAQNLFNMIKDSPVKINRSQAAFFLTEAEEDNKSVNTNRSHTLRNNMNSNSNPVNINASKFKQKLMNTVNKQSAPISKNKIQKRDKSMLKNQLLKKKTGRIGALGFNHPNGSGPVPGRKVISSGYGGANAAKKMKAANTKMSANPKPKGNKAANNISSINNISVLENSKMSRTAPVQQSRQASVARTEGTSMQTSMHRAQSMVQLLPGGRVKRQQRPSSSVSPDKRGGGGGAAASKKRGTKSAPSLLEAKTSGRLGNSRNAAINSSSHQSKDAAINSSSTTAAAKARKPMFTTAKLNADIALAVPQRNTSELLTILEEVGKKEGLRKNTNQIDSDNINQLTQRVKNIGSKLENATNLSMKYKELANEDIKFRS